MKAKEWPTETRIDNIGRNRTEDDMGHYDEQRESDYVKSGAREQKLAKGTTERLAEMLAMEENLKQSAEQNRAPDSLGKHDPVNNPKHYAIAPSVEAIDIIKASMTPEQFKGYLLGNFLKYRLRAGDKGDLQQDIDKSNWYRERLNAL